MATTLENLRVAEKQPKKKKIQRLGVRTFCYRLAEELAANNPKGLVSWSELMQELTANGIGLRQIQAAQKIRYLIDSGQLTPIDSCSNMFLFYRNITEFERRQEQLQKAWLAANEIAILQVMHKEAKEVNQRHE